MASQPFDLTKLAAEARYCSLLFISLRSVRCPEILLKHANAACYLTGVSA